MFGRFTVVARIFGRPIFLNKTCLSGKTNLEIIMFVCLSQKRQEKKGRPFPKAIAKFKVETFPRRHRPLIKPLFKKNPQNVKGTGP
jgi:hypothetical protein